MVERIGIEVLENEALHLEVALERGGKIVSLRHRDSGRELLWCNPKLALHRCRSGDDYDRNFYGGMDELPPNDSPEDIDGIRCPITRNSEPCR